MHCYQVYRKTDDQLLGVATSFNFRYYNPKSKKILKCQEDLAQYIEIDYQLYTIGWFQPEVKEMEGKYPMASLEIISKEKYDEYMAAMAKVESEQK